MFKNWEFSDYLHILAGVTNAQERLIRKGFDDSKVPQTSVEFSVAWEKSSQSKKTLQEQKDFEDEIEANQPAKEFMEEVRQQKRTGARKGGVYTVSFFTQVLACVVCTYKL